MDSSSPNLESLLEQLAQLQRRGGLPVETEGARDWYEVMLFPPATESAAAVAQSLMRKRLPDDFLRFWEHSNGANLFLNESGLHGVGVASTELIWDLQREESEFYSPEAMAPYIVFARVNGAGDFLVFDVGTGRVLDGIHSEQPHEWRPVAASFTEWLARLIDCHGRYYWIESLYREPIHEAAPTEAG